MKDIKRVIIDKAEEYNFSGVVSIFKNNTEIINESFGFRNVADGLPNEKNTKFGIASGTKLFTALGIGKLIEQQKINLNTKVMDINKDFCTFIDRHATILNLLTHTSGIYDYYDEEINSDSDDFFVNIPWNLLETPLDYLPLFINQKPKFKPGERFSYSNGNSMMKKVMAVVSIKSRMIPCFTLLEVMQVLDLTQDIFQSKKLI